MSDTKMAREVTVRERVELPSPVPMVTILKNGEPIVQWLGHHDGEFFVVERQDLPGSERYEADLKKYRQRDDYRRMDYAYSDVIGMSSSLFEGMVLDERIEQGYTRRQP